MARFIWVFTVKFWWRSQRRKVGSWDHCSDERGPYLESQQAFLSATQIAEISSHPAPLQCQVPKHLHWPFKKPCAGPCSIPSAHTPIAERKGKCSLALQIGKPLNSAEWGGRQQSPGKAGVMQRGSWLVSRDGLLDGLLIAARLILQAAVGTLLASCLVDQWDGITAAWWGPCRERESRQQSPMCLKIYCAPIFKGCALQSPVNFFSLNLKPLKMRCAL